VNSHAPVKRNRVREQDIPYMTREWKNALKMKRKYVRMFVKDRTVENLELKREDRNLARRERRKAIRTYWYKNTEKHKDRPDKFYYTFKPFISNKGKGSTTIQYHSEHDSVKSIREVYEENDFDFKLLRPNKVQRALENINPKKSSGWDSAISPRLLKSVAKGKAISPTTFIIPV